MSGFVRSLQSCHRSNHQPPVTTRLIAISIVGPTGHSPRSRTSSRPPSRLRAVSLVGPKAPSSVFSAFCPNVRKCPVLSGLLNAIPVITINHLSQQDLQQFPSCGRPDIPDIPSQRDLSASAIGNGERAIGTAPNQSSPCTRPATPEASPHRGVPSRRRRWPAGRPRSSNVHP